MSGGGGDGFLRIWAPRTAVAVPGRAIPTTAVIADRLRVMWVAFDGSLHRWDLATGRARMLRAGETETGGGILARVSADGSTVAQTVRPIGAVHRYAVRGRRSRLMADDGTQRFALALDRNGRRTAVAARGRLTIFEGDHASVTVPVPVDQVNALAFSPDGRHLATAAFDGSVRVLDAGTGKRERTLTDGGVEVADIAYSTDGRRIVTSGIDGTIRTWPVTGGEPATLYGHKAAW